MSVLWILEKRNQNHSLTDILIGNYPTRVFSSLESLLQLAPLADIKPSLLLIDTNSTEKLAVELDGLLRESFPRSCIIHFNCHSKVSGLNVLTAEQVANPLALMERIRTEIVKSRWCGESIKYQDLVLDLFNFKVSINGIEQSELSLTEFKLLQFFVEHAKVCVSREKIAKGVWGNTAVSLRNIDSYVSRLRKRLQYSKIEINSKYGSGYIFS